MLPYTLSGPEDEGSIRGTEEAEMIRKSKGSNKKSGNPSFNLATW